MTESRLNSAQWAAARQAIEGRHVYDFGCGNCELALQMLDHGAASVTPIDKLERPRWLRSRKGLRPYVGMEFGEWARATVRLGDHGAPVPRGPEEVALVSWPTNRQSSHDLVSCLRQFQSIVHVAGNTNGSICGSRDLYRYLLGRQCVAAVRARPNDLVLYGPPLPEGTSRVPVEVEVAGIDTQTMYGWVPSGLVVIPE